MLITVMALLLTSAFQMVNAQQTRTFKKHIYIGSDVNAYVTFDATFAGFAGRMSVNNTQLYIMSANSNIMSEIENQNISKEYYSEIGTSAYKVPRFTLYMEGYTSIGDYYSKKYSDKPFKLQVSDALGDFTTPEFSGLDENKYSGDNSWENTGDISDYPVSFKVTEIYFKDYDIRVK
jgi:hypothetical protein